MTKRYDELWCGCTRIEKATVEEASAWLMEQIEGSTHVEVSIVVGGDRCSLWRNKEEPGWPKTLEKKSVDNGDT